jgi:hypothetical protein
VLGENMKPTLSKKEGFKSDAQRKAAFANGYEEKDKKNEGKKRFKRQDGIGKAKYTISYHDGKKKHKDGSDFFDIQIFRNKKDLSNFVGTLVKKGYKLTRESVNERINPKFYDARVQYIDPKSKKKFVGDVVRYDNGEYKVNLGKDGRFEKYILAKEKDLKIVSKSKKKTFESVNEGISVSDERHFGKKGIIIMIDDNGKKVSAIFKDKKNADKFNRNKSSDIQKLLQLAKKTKYPKAIDESLNEAGKLAMGIAALTGTRGSAVQDFIDKNRINDKKLFKALKKANLQGRINFASALAGRPGNPNEKLTIKLFGESKKEVIAFRKKAKSETAFYDILDKIERKYGRGVFEKWLDKSLKDLKLNPKKYKTSADKQEALFQAKL